ncbi:DUF2061 domain-containing protein [Caenispirillum salinarum]|uniref:DUF2061 domain-containing protein n=1 Tax=Caenispirillum salinarum TaxID=859058 RepID=UPI000A036CD7|nr:DUF2061 domain-containing protein [Caenispirillum salinarum]
MRSLIKTVTFAAVHFTVAFSVAYALTGSIAISSALALVEPMVNTVAYFFHERIWEAADRLKLGRMARRYSPSEANRSTSALASS